MPYLKVPNLLLSRPFFSLLLLLSSPLLERRAGTTETAMTAGRRGNGADLGDLENKNRRKKAGEFGITTRIHFFISAVE